MRSSLRSTLSRVSPARGVLNVFVALILIILVAPILIIVPLSLSSARYFVFPPPGFSLQWYERFLGRPEWTDSIVVSLEVAVLSTVISLAAGVPAALALVRGRFRLKALVYGLTLAPMILPSVIISISLFFFFSRFGMIGSPVAIALGHSVVALPVVVLIMSATLSGFDIQLENAAVSLGASPFQAFRRVTLPLVASGVASSAIFAFLVSFDELMISLFLATPNTVTLPVRIWTTVLWQVEPTIAAVSTLLIVIALCGLILTMLIQSRGHQK
jgi:putative spermidine/putrescine transport system permease protein